MALLDLFSKEKKIESCTAGLAKVEEDMTVCDDIVTTDQMVEDASVLPKQPFSPEMSGDVATPQSPAGDRETISVDAKVPEAHSLPDGTDDKINETSEQGQSLDNIVEKGTPGCIDNASGGVPGSDNHVSSIEKETEHSEDVASGTELSDAQRQEDGINAVIHNIEHYLNENFSYLFKLQEALRQDMQELTKKIETLNADAFVKLGESASRIEKLKSERDKLTSSAATNAEAMNAVVLENCSLKKERQGLNVKAQLFETEKSALMKENEVLKTKVLERDSLLAGKEKEKNELIFAHDTAVSQLNADHEKAVAELKKLQSEKIEALNRSMFEKIQHEHASIEAFVPSKVCDLFDYKIGDVGDVHSKWQAIYAYLGFINGSLRQDAFVRRFREFDAAFYDAMRDTPDILSECRVRVQKHINEELGNKTGGLFVYWPKIGESCNPDQYTTTSEFGQHISEVISAMIYKRGDDGSVLCQSKGKVATA